MKLSSCAVTVIIFEHLNHSFCLLPYHFCGETNFINNYIALLTALRDSTLRIRVLD